MTAASVVEHLTAEFNGDAHWDQIARDFITAEGNLAEDGTTALIASQWGEIPETAAEVSRRFLGLGYGGDRVVQAAFGLVGVLLLWFVVSTELYDFFYLLTGGDIAREYGTPRLVAQTVLSAVWAAYAHLIRHWDITRLPYDGEADRYFDPNWLTLAHSA